MALRRWRPEDAPILHQAVKESVEHLRPWMGWVAQEPLALDQRRAMLRRWEQTWLGGGDANYGIFVGDDVAGACGLHYRRGPKAIEIGYWVHPAFLRRGAATGAAWLLTDAAFAVPGIEHVEIHHDKANERSRGVPHRLGYRLTGEAPDPRDAPAEIGIDCTWRVDRAAWLSQEGRDPII